MKITTVQPIPLAMPYQTMDPLSPWTESARKQLLVRVETDEATPTARRPGMRRFWRAFAVFGVLAVLLLITVFPSLVLFVPRLVLGP